MRDDVAFAEEIDCSEPHSLELYNVVQVAPALTAQVKDYADLLDQKSPLYLKIRDQVNDRCMAGSAYGRAQRKAGGLPVQLEPALNVDAGLHVAWDPFPADLWARGQKKFVCTFEQEEPGTLRFADIPTSRLPVAARVCLDTPRKYLPVQPPPPGRGHRRDGPQHGDREGPDHREEGRAPGRRRALRGAQRRRLRQARQDLHDVPESGLHGQGSRRGPGLPRLGVPVADGEGRLPRQLLRAQAVRAAAPASRARSSTAPRTRSDRISGSIAPMPETPAVPRPPYRAIDEIPGWFQRMDMEVFHHLLDQTGSRLGGGDLAELGAYLGKSAALIGFGQQPGETFTVIDLFEQEATAEENRAENEDQYAELSQEAFEKYYLTIHDTLPVVVRGPSASIVDHAAHGTHRFVHIDASHLYEHVVEDIAAARKLLKPGGVVVFDDFRAQHTPGVAAAVWRATNEDLSRSP